MKAIVPHEIEEYATAHSAAPDALLDELERYTRAHCESPQMLVGALEGGLLRMLAAGMGARQVLEIGTFTGYSALAMAAALPEDGTLTTCEIDEDRATIAQSFFDRSPYGGRIELRRGPAIETLATLSGPVDFVFLDADKESYVDYYEACLPLLRQNGIIAVDNVLWSGRVLEPKEESDRAIVRFNTHVRNDPRTEVVMLTVRDGLSLIRKL